jgi:hypothetical protein
VGLIARIAEVMQDENCLGGSVAVEYQAFVRSWMKLYAFGWKFWERIFNMKQGAAQFCRQSAFVELGGFDESIYLAEDVEFYWRLAPPGSHTRRQPAFYRRSQGRNVVETIRQNGNIADSRGDEPSLYNTLP